MPRQVRRGKGRPGAPLLALVHLLLALVHLLLVRGSGLPRAPGPWLLGRHLGRGARLAGHPGLLKWHLSLSPLLRWWLLLHVVLGKRRRWRGLGLARRPLLLQRLLRRGAR